MSVKVYGVESCGFGDYQLTTDAAQVQGTGVNDRETYREFILDNNPDMVAVLPGHARWSEVFDLDGRIHAAPSGAERLIGWLTRDEDEDETGTGTMQVEYISPWEVSDEELVSLQATVAEAGGKVDTDDVPPGFVWVTDRVGARVLCDAHDLIDELNLITSEDEDEVWDVVKSTKCGIEV